MEQQRKQRAATKRDDHVDEAEATARDEVVQDLLDDTDDLLDEIDEVLEEAEENEFVRIALEALERAKTASPCGCGGDDLYRGDNYGIWLG